MFRRTRLVAAGLMVGSALSAPAAFADQYEGFYVSAWGGAGSVDMGSRDALDEAIFEVLPTELLLAGLNASTADQLVEYELTGLGDSTLDDSLSVWGVQIGYRWNKYVALELGYANLGQGTYSLPGTLDITIETDAGVFQNVVPVPFERAMQFTSSGPTVTALGIFPLGSQVELHGRAGLYLADTRVTNRIRATDEMENISHRRVDASETELLGGVGATWNATESFSVRVEYQRFFDVGGETKTGESDVDVFNLSVVFR
jgi:OmpA-OmpF porin, OOP family